MPWLHRGARLYPDDSEFSARGHVGCPGTTQRYKHKARGKRTDTQIGSVDQGRKGAYLILADGRERSNVSAATPLQAQSPSLRYVPRGDHRFPSPFSSEQLSCVTLLANVVINLQSSALFSMSVRRRHAASDLPPPRPPSSASSITRLARALDVYPKTLPEFNEKTDVGGLVSVCAVGLIVALLVSQLSAYFAVRTHEHLSIDVEREQLIRINLNVTFPAIPCAGIGLVTMDVAGEQQIDVLQNLAKTRLSPDGAAIGPDDDPALRARREGLRARARGAGRAPRGRDDAGGGGGAGGAEPERCGQCYEDGAHEALFQATVERTVQQARERLIALPPVGRARCCHAVAPPRRPRAPHDRSSLPPVLAAAGRLRPLLQLVRRRARGAPALPPHGGRAARARAGRLAGAPALRARRPAHRPGRAQRGARGLQCGGLPARARRGSGQRHGRAWRRSRR